MNNKINHWTMFIYPKPMMCPKVYCGLTVDHLGNTVSDGGAGYDPTPQPMHPVNEPFDSQLKPIYIRSDGKTHNNPEFD